MLALNKSALPVSLQLPTIISPKPKKRNVKNLALYATNSQPLQVAIGEPNTPGIFCETPGWLKPQKAIYYDGPIEILPNLYLGDETNASNPDTLRNLNIGFVLNVAREVENSLLDHASSYCWQFISNSRACLYLKKHTFSTSLNEVHSVFSRKLFWDHNQDNILEFFGSSFGFIDLARSLGVGVLVHCQGGVSRSASLMMGYVMHANDVNFEKAYQFVKSRSSAVSPNLGLIAQLLEYEKPFNFPHYDPYALPTLFVFRATILPSQTFLGSGTELHIFPLRYFTGLGCAGRPYCGGHLPRPIHSPNI
ncbi:tyrosine/serine/threonine protein phosphatase [Massospora cicadina]|nr:tyrosine/serine/threonine protein phosphatase [Massospora cicadina]